jgi:hypothetical protein
MITIQSIVDVENITAQKLLDFMLYCTDADYQKWWPGTHLQFHTVRGEPGKVGSLVYFDEFVGRRRLKFHGVIREVKPGRKVTWQMQAGFDLPAWLSIELEEKPQGVHLIHTLAAGFDGPGRVLDPLLRLYLSPTFARELDEHAHTEFPRLGEMLRPG